MNEMKNCIRIRDYLGNVRYISEEEISPIQFKILSLCQEDWKSMDEMVAAIGKPKSTIHEHVQKLVVKGWLRQRRWIKERKRARPTLLFTCYEEPEEQEP